MSDTEIKVPNIGEFKDVEVIEILVSNGQSILKNDPLITIESEKSSVEIPSSFEGKVKLVNIKVGDKVSEGDVILILENSEKITKDTKEQLKIEKEKIKAKPQKKTTAEDIPNQNFSEKSKANISPASPKTRKFARELGVDINQISGSERQGRVLESDVKNFISSKINKVLDNKKTKPKKIIRCQIKRSMFQILVNLRMLR